MTKSLTEKFMNDELPLELYYFKQKMSEKAEIGTPFALNMVRATDDEHLDWFLIDKILAPVPDYKQFISLKRKVRVLEKKLDIAVNALKQYRINEWPYEDEYNYYPKGEGGWYHAEEALKKMKGIR